MVSPLVLLMVKSMVSMLVTQMVSPLVVEVVIDGNDDDVLPEVVSDILLIKSANIDNTSSLLLLLRMPTVDSNGLSMENAFRVSGNTLPFQFHIAMPCGFGLGGLESTGWRCRNGQPVGFG